VPGSSGNQGLSTSALKSAARIVGRYPLVVDVDARGGDDEHAATALIATGTTSPMSKFLWVCLMPAVWSLEVRGMQEARDSMRPPEHRTPGSIS
jgi:hypothetical protein